jgi:hypothetical protein
MILTEEGLNFRRDGDLCRCVEHPQILELPDRRYMIDGRPESYATARQALDVLEGRSPALPQPARRRQPRR